MKRRKWQAFGVTVAILCCLSVVLAGPALARIMQAQLLAAMQHGISGSVTYKVTNQGRDVGQTTTGVVGEGTISGKLSLGAQLSATLLGAVKGIPMTAITRGGTYVVRYDVDAKGNHKGLLVIKFKSPGVGTLCVNFGAKYGRFVPGKTDYVPSAGSFSTTGGSGAIAKVHASGRFDQGEVTGSTIEQILAAGSVDTLAIGPASSLNAPCTAVARLAKT